MPGDARSAGPGSAPSLRRSDEIARVLRSGVPFRSERVIVFLAAGAGPSRGAWVAGRRIGGAVARNRARRLLREAWWAVAPRLEDGHDVVLVARLPLDRAKASDVIGEVEGLLRKAGVMQA